MSNKPENATIDPPAGLPENPLESYAPEITEILAHADGFRAPLTEGPVLNRWTISEENGNRLDYTLHRLSGEGGFGQVWEATQTSLQRTVALKIIKSQFHDGRELSRLVESTFKQEAITTARLEHPNIVPIYDLGADGSGRPVLAMKFVDGRLWTELLNSDLKSMTFEDFLARHLQILVSVTQAVAYAHSRGVIHRDIKSSQVMVGEFGETLLMDWGLALDINTRATERASDEEIGDLETQRASNPAGTVAYMAPEQTRSDPSKIGPWTDVYLLGGVLYTLLTGLPVHPAAEGAKAFAQAREGFYIDPLEAAPSRALPADLLTLVRDALQADVERRIATAAQFLERLHRYLSGSGKRAEAEKHIESAGALLEKEQKSYRDYTEALNHYERAAQLWAGNPRLGPLREDANEGFGNAALRNGDLVLARLLAQQLPADRGQGLLLRVDAEERAISSQKRYRKVSVALIATLGVLLLISGLFYLMSMRRERDLVRFSMTREAQARERAEDLMRFMLTDLRSSLEPIGKLALLDQITGKADAYFRSIPPTEMSDESRAQRADLLDTVGEIFFVRGDLRHASSAYDQAFTIRKSLVQRHPDRASWMSDLARSHYNRAKMFESAGETRRALDVYAEGEKLLTRVVAKEPSNFEFNRRLGATRSAVGELLLAQGEAQSALGELERANTIYSALSVKAPADGELRRELAVTYSKVGDAYDALGRTDDAMKQYVPYAQIMAELVAREPKNLQWRRELAVAHNSLGWAWRAKGDASQALNEFYEQRRGMMQIVAEEPDNIRWQRELAFSEAVIGRTLQGLGRQAEAVEHLQSSSSSLRKYAESDPHNSAWQRDAAVSQSLLGEALLLLGRRNEALQDIQSALTVMEELMRRDPENTGWRRDTAQFHRLIGGILLDLGKRGDAETQLRAAVELMQPLTKDPATAPVAFVDTHASALLLLGRKDEAKPLVDALRARGYNNPQFLKLAGAR